jgi:hypothetical protein
LTSKYPGLWKAPSGKASIEIYEENGGVFAKFWQGDIMSLKYQEKGQYYEGATALGAMPFIIRNDTLQNSQSKYIRAQEYRIRTMNGVSRSLVRILVIAIGAKELTPGQEDAAAWVLVVAMLPFMLRLGIVLMIGSGATHRSIFTDDVFFYSRTIVGSGLLGLGLSLAARKRNRFVIRMCLIWSAILLIGPLLELLAKGLDMPSIYLF